MGDTRQRRMLKNIANEMDSRVLQENGWIRRSDRLPAQEDGDSQGRVFVWHVYQGVMLAPWNEFLNNSFHAYWMPLADDPHSTWINAAEKLPTKQDADALNCVLARSVHGENMVTGYHQFGLNRTLVLWKRLPDPPSDHRELRKMI